MIDNQDDLNLPFTNSVQQFWENQMMLDHISSNGDLLDK